MRDEMPVEIQSLIDQCEANVKSFTNNQMSAALHFAETMHVRAGELLEACQALPNFDIESPDAADFKDNANAFMNAMRLARAAISKAESPA